MVLTLKKIDDDRYLEYYETKNNFSILANTIGFGVDDKGTGRSAELELLKQVDAETGEVITGISMNVNQHEKEIAKLELLNDYFGVQFTYDEDGNAETITDSTVLSELSVQKNLIKMVVNPSDGSTPASIKIGAIADSLNTSSGVMINANKIKLSSSEGTDITLGDKVDVLGDMSVNGGNISLNGNLYCGLQGDKYIQATTLKLVGSGSSQGADVISLGASDIKYMIVDAKVDTESNTLQLWKKGDPVGSPSITFSKAITSWTTEWSNGAIVMTAKPQNQSNSYTPSLGLFGTTQYPSFTADIYESVQSGTPISRKQVSGYLIETVNGTSSHVDVSKNSDGSGSAVARISTANTWTSGRNTGWDGCYNSINITGPTAGQIDYGASATVVVKATDKGGTERTLFNRTYSSKADRYPIGKQDGIDETMAKITAKSSTITANGTYTASTDNLLGYSSVVVNVSGTNYSASDVTLSDGIAGTPTVNQSDNNWYAPVDVTKTLGGTQDTDTITVNVQSAINAGVQAGWDSAKGVSSLPQAKESGWDSYIDVSIPGSAVGATYADTFTMTGDGKYVYLQNSDGDNVARFTNSLSITSLTPNRLQPTGMTVSRTVTAQTYDQYMVVYLNINGLSQVVKYLVKINAKT